MGAVLFGKRLFEPELIIFDKDGTLTDFRKTWIPILDKRLEIILKKVKIELPQAVVKSRVYETFGITEDRIDPYGPFPYSPPWEDEIIFATVLYELGIPYQEGKMLAHYSIKKAEEELDRTKFTVMFNGVREVLEELKNSGLLLTLATADLTEIANSTLKNSGIYDLFDYVIGADMVENGKPHPEMIHKIVETLKVEKKKTVLVGDTITDMEMGKKAGIGLVIGVTESGIASRGVLEKYADVVINSVRDIRVV